MSRHSTTLNAMPTSKKRTKNTPTKPTGRRTIPSPLTPRETEDQLASRAREQFLRLAQTEGHLFPAIKGYEPYGPPIECWTNAWVYSQATGLGYAEGIALMPNGWHAHAWCVTEDGAVIEPTLGYDHATEYRGWQLNTEGITAVHALLDDTPRTSFLEAGIASQVAPWEEIRDRFCAIPGTI
jgi:hypothetical protein